MKVYIRSNQSRLKLSDIIKSIRELIIVDNVEKYKIGTTEDYETYKNYTDEQLGQISDLELKSIRDPFILNRIKTLYPDRNIPILSATLKDYLARQFSLKKEDIEYIVNLLHNCKKVDYVNSTYKTSNFTHDLNLSKDDVATIIRSVKPSDFDGYTQNFGLNDFSDILIMFVIDTDVVLSDGRNIKGIQIYLKIDYNATTDDGSTVGVVSFHLADYVKTQNHAERRKSGKDYPIGHFNVKNPHYVERIRRSRVGRRRRRK